MTDVVALLDRPWRILALAVVASAGLVAGAHFFETVVGLPPCPLCLDQREAHWTAIGLAALGLGAMRASSAAPIGAAALGALALVYGFSAVLAGYHAGVEWRFWPGPATCGGGGAIDIDPAVLLDALDETPGPVSCADAPWRLLGVSMAGYNALFSAALFAVAGVGAVRFANREDRS
ncbi:MAG: disulfide bond formation protein B [Pseudomonadota bacterium]